MVLLVDHEETHINVVVKTFTDKQIPVQVANTGAEAITIFEQRIKLVEQGKAQMFKLLLFELNLQDI